MKITTAGILALCACAAPRMAAAQTMQWTDKGYVTVNGGGQFGSHDLSQSGSFPLYDETATFTSTTKVKSGGMFDLGGAYKVWKNNFLVGVSYSHVSSKSDGSVTGSIPDPVFFDQPRTVNSTVPGLKHSENQVHIDAVWMMPVANKLDVGFSAGPTIFAVKQDTIQSLTVTEPGPTVTAAGGFGQQDDASASTSASTCSTWSRRSGASAASCATRSARSRCRARPRGSPSVAFSIGGGARLRF